MDDVVLNKAATIEKRLRRVREEYAGDDRNVRENQTKQDAIVLNIQRACEAAIDLAMHLVRRERLGMPQEARGAFELLADAGRIPPELREPLKRMVGFRNVAVHEYRKLDLEIVAALARGGLPDLAAFAAHALRTAS